MTYRIHILGTHKGGTTKLFECIAGHPKVFGSVPKQNLYFVNKLSSTTDIMEYFSSIGMVSSVFDFTVDATPEHLFVQKCIEKICELPGDYLCLVSLRNPIDRAFSHWAMTQQDKGKKEFLKLALSGSERVRHIIERSKYSAQISNLISHCPNRNLEFIIFEEWTKNPKIFINLMIERTGLDLGHYWKTASENHRYNNKFLFHLSKIYHRTPLKNIVSKKMRIAARNFLVNISPLEGLTTEEKLSLAPIFADDVKRTEELINKKIISWDEFNS